RARVRRARRARPRACGAGAGRRARRGRRAMGEDGGVVHWRRARRPERLRTGRLRRRMADPLRRAGTGRFVDRTDVVWTVAEGRRGRRWREVRSRDGVVLSSLLLETDTEQRFAHLELSTPAGLLTLHPEPDGTLPGNAVTGRGARHVEGVPWPAGSLLVVDGSAISIAAAAWEIGSSR